MKRGFTLIEVVLALAILSVGLFGLLMAASRCLAVIGVSRDYEVARRTLDRGELDHPLISHIRVSDIEVFGRTYEEGFRYSRSVEEVPNEDDLFIVRSVVKAPAGKSSRRLEVTRYFYTTNYPGRDFGEQ
jgi:prepilin-type N-terminal cleavage/methylation domain-containing protein